MVNLLQGRSPVHYVAISSGTAWTISRWHKTSSSRNREKTRHSISVDTVPLRYLRKQPCRWGRPICSRWSPLWYYTPIQNRRSYRASFARMWTLHSGTWRNLQTLVSTTWIRIYSSVFHKEYLELRRRFCAACDLTWPFTNAYSFQIGMANSPTCDNCSCEETIAHFLCECPRFSAPRKELSRVLDELDKHSLSEEQVLGHWPRPSLAQKALKALLRFLRRTGLRDRL